MLAHGQKTAVLTGQVTEAATGKPMPFANVYVNGSTQGAVTDENGAYKLSGIPLGTVEIVASFVGYVSVTHKIRFENTSPQKANFALEASAEMLDAVTIKGNPKGWERHLRQFKKQLFGEPFGGQCVLVNSEVLNFKEDKGHLYATASEPLIIENQALGYRLIYALQHFDATSVKVYSAGTSRFEELKPENERQAERFLHNRQTAYKGSIRHLMASLIDNSYEQAGFLVYQEDPSRSIPIDRRTITLEAAVREIKRLVPVKIATLIQPGRLPNERKLFSPLKLVVLYTKASSTFSPYPDARYAYTEIRLPSGQLQMTSDGVITIPEGMEAQGSMASDRLSTMLPAEWTPRGNQQEELTNGPLVTQGKLALPDTCTSRITVTFNERFKLLSPSVFVHIDKPVYATGDRVWMSAYLLDAANDQRAGGEAAMHVDLLTPAGQLVQHQWIRVEDGRGQGSFRLSDTLAAGTYRLRAYTDEDNAQLGPAFERQVGIYNLFRNETSADRDTLSRSLDIRILPEGGRWISGLPARLGIKIVQPNGHGLTVDGLIVDDIGAEVTRFKTNPQGMTSVSMQPNAQRSYYADVVYMGQRQHIPLPKLETEGMLLSVDAVSDTARVALTVMSANQTASDSVYILIQQRGSIVDQRKMILQKGIAKVSLPMTGWSPGLTQITLYDGSARPQAERLFFVPEFVAPVRMVLALNKSRYQPREQVVMSVSLADNGSPASAALSASITDVNKVSEDSTATLHTHLLLTGELRGIVENANRYLADRSDKTRRDLDDLLLTQGWRRVSGTAEQDLADGLSFTGRVLDSKKQPVPGAHITVASTGAGKSFVKMASADEQGLFKLAGMTVMDTVQLMAQISDSKSKRLSPGRVVLVREGAGPRWEAGKIPALSSGAALPVQMEAARDRQQANPDLYRDKTVKQLEEITVRGQKTDDRPEDVRMRSLHDVADAVAKFDEKSPMYPNLYEMVQGRFAGVTVHKTSAKPGSPPTPPGYNIIIRGVGSFNSGTQPLFLVDGVPIQDPDGTALLVFNPRDIERVEVLKNASTVGIYGVRGANGVIAFYMKRGRSMQEGRKVESDMLPIQFIGYPSVQREFYVPRYDTEPGANAVSGAADDRDVLYWKPLMQTDSKGQSQLRFPLSDKVRTLRVVIQGITSDGRPVSSTQLVQVQ
ncbi:carboxypeptidase-like regulatory domain-containing protein [Dyadobacter soli]|nr:carboxypeptidase-like regulatory domain-containing protein [Dyadobacter soli]